MEQQDLLVDIEQEIYLERASVGARFLNFIIDIIVFYLVEVVLLAILYRAGIIDRETLVSPEAGAYFERLLIGTVFLIGIYTLIEGATKGRTLGKLITGTQAVKHDGSQITFKDAFIRSLCRMVPFEPFSALGGTPWHDKWSNTQVVKVKK